MTYLGCLLSFFLLAYFLFAFAARSFIQTLTGGRARRDGTRRGGREESTARTKKRRTGGKKRQGRIFPKGEGEYVDFEEIKE